MKKIPLILSAVFIVTAPLPLFAADVPPANGGEMQFSGAIDDLPLMPGLALAEDQDILFTTQSAGRIAESTASGSVDVDQVYAFYKNTLPQLGWKPLDAKTYQRENERLSIDARGHDKVTTVHFTVKPAQ